jgi:hypothetical protein
VNANEKIPSGVITHDIFGFRAECDIGDPVVLALLPPDKQPVSRWHNSPCSGHNDNRCPVDAHLQAVQFREGEMIGNSEGQIQTRASLRNKRLLLRKGRLAGKCLLTLLNIK